MIPATLQRPPYNKDTLPPPGPTDPEIKTAVQIEGLRTACALARDSLDYAGTLLKVKIYFF